MSAAFHLNLEIHFPTRIEAADIGKYFFGLANLFIQPATGRGH